MTHSPVSDAPATLRERITDWRSPELRIDHELRMVKNLALAGLHSRNGYQYSEQSLKQAVPLYDGKPVFLDHAVHRTRPQERSTRDLVGSIVNPRFENGRVRGDIQTLDTEAGRTFLALAESDAAAVGMSHVVLARRTQDGKQVEQIEEVISVDAVVFPATTSTFREQQTPAPLPNSWEAIQQSMDEQLAPQVQRLLNDPTAQAARVGIFPEIVLLEVTQPDRPGSQLFQLDWSQTPGTPQLGQELRPLQTEELQNFLTTPVSSPRQQLAELTRERDLLRQQLGNHEQLHQLLQESELPPECITDCFREQLLAAPNRQAQQALIADRQTLLNRPPHSPLSFSRERYPTGKTLDDESIIQCIRLRAG